MNQIITQHGWGFDSRIWFNFRNQFNKQEWLWLNNDRGYFQKNSKSFKWQKESCKRDIKMVICHSLGTHLIERETLLKATHVILINFFYNFLPVSQQRRKFTIKALNRMRNKLKNDEYKSMLEEFIKRSYLPRSCKFKIKGSSDFDLKSINRSILMQDFDKLFITNKPKKLFSDRVNLLIIKSGKDMILDKESANNYIKMLMDTKLGSMNIIELENEGHLIDEINLFEIVNSWLKE